MKYYSNYQLEKKLDKLLRKLISISSKIDMLTRMGEPIHQLENEFSEKLKKYKALKQKQAAKFLIPNTL